MIKKCFIEKGKLICKNKLKVYKQSKCSKFSK